MKQVLLVFTVSIIRSFFLIFKITQLIERLARTFNFQALYQWFLTFFKDREHSDYMKNLRNTKINDSEKQINTYRVEINIF